MAITVFDVVPPLRSKRRLRPPSTVVLHATAGASPESSIAHLRKVRFSYHAIIDRDGRILKTVPYSQAALHAGVSFGPEGADVNAYSLGICFANRNDGIEAVTPAQIEAAVQLIVLLRQQFPDLKWLTTHHLVAPTRKSDPRGVDVRPLARRVGLSAWKPDHFAEDRWVS